MKAEPIHLSVTEKPPIEIERPHHFSVSEITSSRHHRYNCVCLFTADDVAGPTVELCSGPLRVEQSQSHTQRWGLECVGDREKTEVPTHTHTQLWSVLYECRVFEREREMGSELESLKMKMSCSACVCVPG